MLTRRPCSIVSQRGVVFFRNQDLSVDDQKILGQKLGELTGKPESSKVCVQSPSMKMEMQMQMQCDEAYDEIQEIRLTSAARRDVFPMPISISISIPNSHY
jgi:hypothetical protein